MKIILLTIVLLLIFFAPLIAQCPDYSLPGPYSHAYRTENIPGEGETMDNSRIYYPISVGSIPEAAAPCPMVIFAHGWQLGIDRYYSYAEHLASRGYVVVLPAFSSPLFIPDHDRRARLLIYAIHFVNGKNSVTGDIFEGKLDIDNWSMVGHSMGGSLSMLAGDRYTNFPDSVFHLSDTLKAIVVLSSPQSDPATNAANVTTPKMILCGTNDGVVPWDDVRSAFWADAPAPGVFAVINGANHCQFNDYYGGCDEFDGSPDITRDEQKEIARRYVTAFLNRYQMEDSTNCNFLYTYGDSIQYMGCFDSVEVNYIPVSIEESKGSIPATISLSAYPNPFNSSVTIAFERAFNVSYNRETLTAKPLQIRIYDINSRFIKQLDNRVISSGNGKMGILDEKEKTYIQGSVTWNPNENLSSGIYFIRAICGENRITKKIIYLK